jgi:hypothetical protein
VATGGPELGRTKRCVPSRRRCGRTAKGKLNMVALYEVSAEELARIEGGYFLKFVWID